MLRRCRLDERSLHDHLCAGDYLDAVDFCWECLLAWLAQHPPLERVALVMSGRPDQAVLEGMVQLARTRPALPIVCERELDAVFS